MILREKTESLASARGAVVRFALPVENVRMQDNSDGLGPFVAFWDETQLGPRPTVADGFTDYEANGPES